MALHESFQRLQFLERNFLKDSSCYWFYWRESWCTVLSSWLQVSAWEKTEVKLYWSVKEEEWSAWKSYQNWNSQYSWHLEKAVNTFHSVTANTGWQQKKTRNRVILFLNNFIFKRFFSVDLGKNYKLKTNSWHSPCAGFGWMRASFLYSS